MLEEHEENRRISGNMSEVFILIISDVINIDLQNRCVVILDLLDPCNWYFRECFPNEMSMD